MATAAQYADWIVRNKDKKGTPEFDTVAQAYRLAKEQEGAAPQAAPMPAASATEAIPARRGPSLGDIGDRATGFRPVGQAPELSLERGAEGLKTALQMGAGFAAGPLVGGMVRGAGAVIPAIQRVTAPLATAIQSGGFRTGLSDEAPLAARAAMRVAGGATAGAGAATLSGSPEEAATGAVIGGAVPVAGRVISRMIPPKGPSTQDVRKAASEAYGEAERLGGEVTSNQFTNLMSRIATKMDDARFNPILHPRVQRALDAINTEATQGVPVSLNRLDTLRRVMSRAGASSSADEQRLGKLAIDEIDNFIRESMPEASVAMLEKARALYTKMSRSKEIERLITKAERSSQEPSIALRKQFQRLADNERKLKTFSADEQALIKRIADGSMSIKTLETAGALAPPRIVDINSLQGAFRAAGYGGGFAVNPVFTATFGGTGYAARAAANQLARTQAQQLAMQARTGVPAAPFAPQTVPSIFPTLGVNEMAPEPKNALR